MFKRRIHDFIPRGDTRRYSPCSSMSFAGPFAVSIFLAVSFAKVVPQSVPQLAPVSPIRREGTRAFVRLINGYLSVCYKYFEARLWTVLEIQMTDSLSAKYCS